MKFSDILNVMGSYDKLIQAGYEEGEKYRKTGIMKVGKIPYQKINHLDFDKRILSITPFTDKQNRNVLFVQLVKRREWMD